MKAPNHGPRLFLGTSQREEMKGIRTALKTCPSLSVVQCLKATCSLHCIHRQLPLHQRPRLFWGAQRGEVPRGRWGSISPLAPWRSGPTHHSAISNSHSVWERSKGVKSMASGFHRQGLPHYDLCDFGQVPESLLAPWLTWL